MLNNKVITEALVFIVEFLTMGVLRGFRKVKISTQTTVTRQQSKINPPMILYKMLHGC